MPAPTHAETTDQNIDDTLQDSSIHVVLTAPQDEDHLQVAARHLGQFSEYGKCRIGSPDAEGKFHVTLPHVSDETRNMIAQLGFASASADDMRKHSPLPASQLAHYRRNGH